MNQPAAHPLPSRFPRRILWGLTLLMCGCSWSGPLFEDSGQHESMEEKGTAVEKLTSLSQGTRPLTDESKEIYELVLANKTEEADRSATALIESGLASPDQLAEYHLLRGAARHRMGKYEHAREDYSRSIELNPDDWRAYYFRWGVNTDLEDTGAAAADEKKMRQLRPEAPDYRVRGGVI